MNSTRRLILLTVVLPVAVAGLVAVLLMAPGSVEGVYSPLSTMGCAGDQFMEITGGKVIDHVTCSPESILQLYYHQDRSGSVDFRLSSEIDGKPIIRVEPHLLGAKFYHLGGGESEWKWKRFVTRKMKDHMARATIRGVRT